MGDIYLRPLRVEDAAVSYKWRNDPVLWTYTGNRPNCVVTEAMERAWAEKVIADSMRMNFAICLLDGDRYIGNIYLVNLNGSSGELGMFIGDRDFHGRGFGQQALECLKLIAKDRGINNIIIAVCQKNVAAVKTYEKCGAKFQGPLNKVGWVSYIIELGSRLGM